MTIPADPSGRSVSDADPRIDRTTPLVPGDAVAALIVTESGYLLQLRDSIPGIFFPGAWGCFGGAVDEGESERDALCRELHEELSWQPRADAVRVFSRFDFELGFAGLQPIWRVFYEVDASDAALAAMSLGEGAALQVVSANDILSGNLPIVPYDAFALWLHINRSRLVDSV